MKRLKEIYNKLNVILLPTHKYWAVVVFILSLIGAIFEMLGISIIMPLVQVMLEPTVLLEIPFFNNMFKWFGITKTQEMIIVVAIGVIIIYAIKNIYLCVLSYIRVKFAAKIQQEISVLMLHSYMSRGYSFFKSTNSSTLLRGINGSISNLYGFVHQLMKLLAEILTIIFIFVYIFVTDWKLASGLGLFVSGCMLMVLTGFKNIMQRAGELYHENLGKVNKWSLQLFSGIKEIMVLRRQKYFVDNYTKAYSMQQKGNIRQAVASETPAYVIEGVCIAGLITAVCIRVLPMENPAEFFPQLASFAVAAFRLLPSVGRISASYNMCMFTLPAVNEVYENILEAQKVNKKNMLTEKIQKDIETKFNNELKLQGITWKYPDGEINILENLSITIKKGEAVAFIGASGAGKSTLADIILGLYKPERGHVLIDGRDIQEMGDTISNIVSFVPQSIYLIDDTVRRNVAFGIDDQDIDDTIVWRTLEQAKMEQMIRELPDGLDTVIGERGVRFSGGQMQRLAIARALYTEPEILVLDEATSALDNDTEKAVMEAIDELQGEKTLIIIAHRLTTIQNCNKIYEISNGKATEKKYSELV